MASLIPGYEYDIFISYRQKDNKGDRWVSMFVEALKTELESTFKEEISVYFDINPHDGLLETHDVDESLKEKLKSLIFIPVISRTYCDPKSFAWEHEFKAFADMASKDRFGLKVKLPGGNVASRILPVRIHDLDAADLKECESVTGGTLRCIEFIYKEAGVDKPLAPDDDEKKNLNNTKYKIQVIKVAHSIKELIIGMRNGPAQITGENVTEKESFRGNMAETPGKAAEKQGKIRKTSYLIPSLILVMLIVIGVVLYPKIFSRDTLERMRASGDKISVAVMPFQNLTIDTIKWNVYREIIQNSITSTLSNYSQYLQVRQSESISYLLNNSPVKHVPITPSIAQEISKKLEADIFITGDIIQSGNSIRLSVRITDTESGEIIKPFVKETSSGEESLLPIIDTLAGKVRDFLIITRLNKEINPELQSLAYSSSIEAYKYFIMGNNAYHNMDFRTSIELLSKAVEKDSNFVLAITRLASSYFNSGPRELGEKWLEKAYSKRDQVSEFERLWVNLNYARYFKTPYDEIKILKRIMETDDQMPYYYFRMGDIYMRLLDYENAIPEFEKSLDIYKRWNVKPLWSPNYWRLIVAYRKTKQLHKAEKLYAKAEKDFPDNFMIIREHAITLLVKGDSVAAKYYIDKFLSIIEEDSGKKVEPSAYLAYFYAQGNMPDKAEKYYRKALSLDPGNLYNFANFLINNDRNIDEGLELIEKALSKSPDNIEYLHTMGWGLYKQGKYQEALTYLQRSWDFRMKRSIYSHETFLHLEAAKKAVAEQKNN